MPLLGLGVYQNGGETVVSTCLAAFEAGYWCVLPGFPRWITNNDIAGSSIHHKSIGMMQVGLFPVIHLSTLPPTGFLARG
jgi:hypothetical protein